MCNLKSFLFILVLLFVAASSSFAQKSHNDTRKKFSKSESKILDTIAKLPEVRRRTRYVEQHSKNKRHLQYTIWEKPSKKTPYYWVRVMEDNGNAYHIHYNFFVYTNPFVVKYFDPANNKILNLEQWRKNYRE